MHRLTENTIRTEDDALSCIERNYKPARTWRIGLELERIGIYKKDLSPVQYDKATAILRDVGQQLRWREFYDENVLIGVVDEFGAAAISLEPGAQMEISTSPFESLTALRTQLFHLTEVLNTVSKKHDVAWLAVGYHPFARPEDVGRVPKHRYEIMRRHFKSIKGRGLEMMYLTAATQIHLDYSDAADLCTKLRLIAVFSPLMNSLLSSSPFVRSKPSRSARRLLVWNQTDSKRTGIPNFFLNSNDSLREYVQWAMKAPMIMVREDSQLKAVSDFTFADFMSRGFSGRFPTEDDWWQHLSLLFPDIRLRKTIEIRGIDSLPASLAVAVTAFWKGLMYSPESVRAAVDLATEIPPNWVVSMRHFVARRPILFNAERNKLQKIANTLLEISAAGLQRLAVQSENQISLAEETLLQPLIHLIKNEQTPSEIMKRLWFIEWSQDPLKFIEYTSE